MAVSLPEDILALVFDDFACGQLMQWPDAEYDHAKALAPFTLAAVCQQWRYLALNLASIWSYFGFPKDFDVLNLHHSRLRVLLDRSKDAPVDVVVTMGTAYTYRSFYGDQKIWGDLLGQIGRTVHRWRNVRLRLPVEIAVHLRDALQETAPHLTSLSIVIDAPWNLIPRSPEMERLYVEAAFLDNQLPQISTFPQLRTLAFLSNPSATRHPLLVQDLGQIVDLCILDTYFSAPEDTILIFQRLESLTLVESSFLRLIQAPNLHHLALKAESLEGIRNGVRLLPEISSSVTELTLFGQLSEEGVATLRPLCRIQTLRFRSPAAFRTCFPTNLAVEYEYSFEGDVFAAVESSLPRMWPELQHIHFHQPSQASGATLINRDLLKFVASRNSVTTLTDTTSTAKITTVIVEPNICHLDDSAAALENELARLEVLQYRDV